MAALTETTNEHSIDPGSGHVHLVHNANSENLVLAAFQIVPAGVPRRIDVPDPSFCTF